MLTEREVISTLDMLRSEHLDVRTVTLGLNLFDCASDNFDTFAYRVRSKINRHAKNLVAICNEVGDRYGIPVVNKRITVSPIGTVCAGYSRDQMVKVCKLLDASWGWIPIGLPGVLAAGKTALSPIAGRPNCRY